MKLVTLHRQAPLAPDATRCRLCDAHIVGTLQDHLMVGQPGTSRVEAIICVRCGEMLGRMIEFLGPELYFLIEDHRQPREHQLTGPAAVAAFARGAVKSVRTGVAISDDALKLLSASDSQSNRVQAEGRLGPQTE